MVRIGTFYIGRYNQVVAVLCVNGEAYGQGLCSGNYMVIRSNEKLIIVLTDDHTGTGTLCLLLVSLSVEVTLYLLNSFVGDGYHRRHGICYNLPYTVGGAIIRTGAGCLCGSLRLALGLRSLGYGTGLAAHVSAGSKGTAYHYNCKCNGCCTFHHFSEILVMFRAVAGSIALAVNIIVMVYGIILLKVLILVISEF